MGWIINADCSSDPKIFLDAHYSDENNTILLSQMNAQNTVYYAANQAITKTGQKIVFALVVLVQYSELTNKIGWKTMDEGMGPAHPATTASNEILTLLTTPRNEYAAQWRQECLEHQGP